jgi:hypothetical protein
VEEINPALPRAIASAPSTYFEAPDADDLAAVYGKIAGQLRCPEGG